MARCAGVKRDGGRCTAIVKPPLEYCYSHDPERASERKRAASKAGRSKPSRELVGIKTQLKDLTEEVLAGDTETGRAAVANQLMNTRLRAVELERKIREQDEIEERLEALESAREAERDRKEGGSWRG